jgi:histidine ammonia-lyase
MKAFVFGEAPLRISDVVAISRREVEVRLSRVPAFVERIDAGARFLDEMIAEKGEIYGVTTGYGDSCDKKVPRDRLWDLPVRLSRFHGCGLGEHFGPATTRAILAVRLASLCAGFSGVSYRLLEGLAFLLMNDILPLIPSEGSVGASGDLTPLSYVVAALIGEREVLFKGKAIPAAQAMAEAGFELIKLRPKEALALMNGTAAMTGIACLAFARAEYLGALACRLTAMCSLALKGNACHFDERLFSLKPHPGQMRAEALVRRDLGEVSALGMVPERIQDPYSIRCSPHVVGVLFDSLKAARGPIEIEMNSANDNPIVDPETRSIMHGGHFYGGHIAWAMDSTKTAVANVADLLDRQLALLVDEKFNRGLPPNLSGCIDEYSFNHGFKAVQIGASSWAAEALKGTMPASVFSRSTGCHNQDKVSMGTIAARDCIRVLELSEQVAAALLLASSQALRLRLEGGAIAPQSVAGIKGTLDAIKAFFAPLVEDRPLEKELRKALELIAKREGGLVHVC